MKKGGFSMQPKLVIKITNLSDKLVQFTLFKGAQLDTSIISPKQLIALNNGIPLESELEEEAESRILKSIMGECTQDVLGKCTIIEAIKLIRALNHNKEIKIISH